MVAFGFLIVSNASTAQTVIDPWCIKQVSANTAEATMGESLYGVQVNNIKEKQQKDAEYSTIITTSKTLYNMAKENTDNFGEESLTYKRMVDLTASILTKTPQVIRYLALDPKRAVLGAVKMAQIESETKGLVDEMVNIVSGGKVPNPFGDNSNHQDGHNMLNAYDRITAAQTILEELRKINFSLDVLLFKFKNEDTWQNILISVDPYAFYTALDGADVAKNIINGFQSI